MSAEIKLVRDFQWIVYHPDLLGGQPTVKNTPISVAQVLECLSVGMTEKDFAEDYPDFPIEAIPEVLKFAAQELQKPLNEDVGD